MNTTVRIGFAKQNASRPPGLDLRLSYRGKELTLFGLAVAPFYLGRTELVGGYTGITST